MFSERKGGTGKLLFETVNIWYSKYPFIRKDVPKQSRNRVRDISQNSKRNTQLRLIDVFPRDPCDVICFGEPRFTFDNSD